MAHISRQFFLFFIILFLKRTVDDLNQERKTFNIVTFLSSFSQPPRGGNSDFSIFLPIGSLAMPPSNPPSRILVFRVSVFFKNLARLQFIKFTF